MICASEYLLCFIAWSRRQGPDGIALWITSRDGQSIPIITMLRAKVVTF